MLVAEMSLESYSCCGYSFVEDASQSDPLPAELGETILNRKKFNQPNNRLTPCLRATKVKVRPREASVYQSPCSLRFAALRVA